MGGKEWMRIQNLSRVPGSTADTFDALICIYVQLYPHVVVS